MPIRRWAGRTSRGNGWKHWNDVARTSSRRLVTRNREPMTDLLQLGSTAPPFTAPASDGKTYELADVLALERSEEHTSELQSRPHLVCRLLLEKKKKQNFDHSTERYF